MSGCSVGLSGKAAKAITPPLPGNRKPGLAPGFFCAHAVYMSYRVWTQCRRDGKTAGHSIHCGSPKFIASPCGLSIRENAVAHK